MTKICIRYLNRTNDPCGRQYDQMTQAARSVTANIAEGNCLIVLCNRLIMMLGKHLELLLENFRKEGGFTEALTAERLNGGYHLSLTLDDVQGITEFGLALGCQIDEADKVNTGKLIAECIIGGILFGCFVALIAANYANR